MAATDPDRASEPLPHDAAESSAADLMERIGEEIERSERHGTPLACLLLVVENLEQIATDHGSELVGQTLAYLSAALGEELRRFDRVGRTEAGELLILLPGADGPRGEIVARRVIERVGAVKVEADGERRPLSVSVGLAAWEAEMEVEDLLARARAAARRRNGEESGGPPEAHGMLVAGRAGEGLRRAPPTTPRSPGRGGGSSDPGS